MNRREALELALRLAKDGQDVQRVYSWNQGMTADSWFVEVKQSDGVFETLREVPTQPASRHRAKTPKP